MAVPYLDLAPKLKRPLQLWNPLDYLRLIYWVFFFPQALRWYEETFATPEHQKAKGKELWQAITRDIVLSSLVLQALLLVMFLVLFLVLLTSDVMAWLPKPGWSQISSDEVVTIFALGAIVGVLAGVARGVARGVAVGVVVGVALGVAISVAFSVAFSLPVSELAFFVAFIVALGVAFGVAGGVAFGVAGGVAIIFALIVDYGLLTGMTLGVALGLALGMALGVAYGATVLRVDAWIIGALHFTHFSSLGTVMRSTPLPLPGLKSRMAGWLLEDWPTGVHNLNELLAFSMQFVPVVQALNKALAECSQERLIWAVDEVAKDPYDWNLLRFASAPLINGLMETGIDRLAFLSIRHKRSFKARYPTDLRRDTPAHAACAGFWHLHDKQPLQAARAFAVVRGLPGGEELWRLSQALRRAQAAEDLSSLADLAELKAFRQATTRPSKSALILHPATWQALEHLYRAAQEAHTVRDSSSGAARSRSLNRAIGEVVAVQSLTETLPLAERAIIEEIGKKWQKALVSEAGKIGQVKILDPVQNPYVAGNPVVGKGFVGREDILNQLIELWSSRVSTPSVVLFGHRRMGKTSILRNIDSYLGSDVHLAYISLLTLGDAPGGVSDLFLAMADKIREVLPGLAFSWDEIPGTDNGRLKEFLEKEFEIGWVGAAEINKFKNGNTINIYFEGNSLSLELDDEKTKGLMKIDDGRTYRFIAKMENGKLNTYFPGHPKVEETLFDIHPYWNFEQFLVQARSDLGTFRLIIALDEFEKLEEWIRDGSIPRNLLEVLRSYVQIDPHIAFAFAGLHTLEEMTADYFEPFFASVLPIRVSFLSHDATFRVLADPPIEDFPLDYEPEALERIWQLTGGQPYLVQLIGHYLVSRFNNLTFEKGKTIEPVFKAADVEEVVEDPEFYSRGRYYFAGVLGQAGQGAPGQQEVLKILASSPGGLSWDELLANFGPKSAELKAALDELQRHDVLIEYEGRWQYTVELMLRWVKSFL